MQLYSQIRLHAGSGGGAADANAATFYPYYSLLQPDLYTPNGEAAPPPCALVIGNFVKGSNNSINDFGQSDQYGQKPNRGWQQQPVITRPICGEQHRHGDDHGPGHRTLRARGLAGGQ